MRKLIVIVDKDLLGDGSKCKTVFTFIAVMGLIACNVLLSMTVVLNMEQQQQQPPSGFNNNNIDATSSSSSPAAATTTTTTTTSPNNPRDNSGSSLRQPTDMQQDESQRRIQRQRTKTGLEFVHIPKTGGSAVEEAAWKHAKIKWGANHYNRKRALHMRRFIGVPYWHVPPHYYRRNRIDDSSNHTIAAAAAANVVDPAMLGEFDPYGSSPYTNATALFTIVRNPYARAVSEYLYYHRDGRHYSIDIYNREDKLNTWLTRVLRGMEGVLSRRTAQTNNNNKSSSKFTIDTAGHWNKPLEMNRKVTKWYFHLLGHFIPQYDYVYDTPLETIPAGDNGGEEEEERLPPPPKPVIQHVLHFEHLQEEFANLMALYNLEHIVLPNPPPPRDGIQQQQQQLVGVMNLTDSTKRLIEKVYARDFAAFGYEKMMQ